MILEHVSQFLSNYKLLYLLGNGGYGSVYMAKQISTQNYFAVKIVDDDNLNNRTWYNCQLLQHDNADRDGTVESCPAS